MAQIVTALPVHGDVILGRDRAGRVLRISRHADAGRVVLSIWDTGRCMATVRLATEDVPNLVRALVDTLVDEPPAPLPRPVSASQTIPLTRDAGPWDAARQAADRIRSQVRRRFTH